MLMQLPNGDWIDPARITAIRRLPREQGQLGHLHPPRVAIHLGGDPGETIPSIHLVRFESDEEAMAFEESLALTSNCRAR